MKSEEKVVLKYEFFLLFSIYERCPNAPQSYTQIKGLCSHFVKRKKKFFFSDPPSRSQGGSLAGLENTPNADPKSSFAFCPLTLLQSRTISGEGGRIGAEK